MTLREFLHDRQIFLLCQLGYLMFAGLLLSMLRVGGFALFFLCGLYLCITLVVLGSEFVKKRSYFNTAFQLLEQLEEKSYLSEILETPDFIEGQKLAEIFRIVSKATNDTVARHRHRWEDYSEYIETWVHEIKTPIASCKLIIENHSDEVTRSLGEEIDRIDQYVEQALYYTRSTVVEKDYVIRRCSLRQLVSQAVRAQAKSLIGHQFRIEMGEDLEQVRHIDRSGLHPKVADTKFIVMSDVTNPLLGRQGATYTFGPQKGADPQVLQQLEQGMDRYARLVSQTTGVSIATVPGGGAAGGMGAACLAFLNAEIRSGIQTVLDLAGFDALLEQADLVITGEGRLDGQSVGGKAVSGIARRCREKGVPVLAIAGSLGEGYEALLSQGVCGIMTLPDRPMLEAEAMEDAQELYRNAARRAFLLLKLGHQLKGIV